MSLSNSTSLAWNSPVPKATLISIVFDGGAKNVVFPGQFVTGHVHIETTERIKMRGVRLELHGKAFVHWTVGVGNNSTNYMGKEEYMNLEIYLTGSRNNPSDLYLEPGAHNFPFTFEIPPEVPQSFESNIGRVRYTAKAVIDRPIKTDDNAEIKLTVARLFDLNREPLHLREPLSMQNQSSVTGFFGCLISGAIEMNLRLNKGCFTPGETILVEGELRNGSDSIVGSTTISFVQKIIYFEKIKGRLNGNSTAQLNVLGSVERTGLAMGQSDSFQNIAFRVPFLPPSRLDGCNIINIVYYVELRASLTACFTFSITNCEVIIGNVPLEDSARPSVITNQPIPSLMQLANSSSGSESTFSEFPPLPASDEIELTTTYGL